MELVLDVERTLPIFLLRRVTTQIDRIERKHRHWYNFFTDVVSSRSIVKDVQNFSRNVRTTLTKEARIVFYSSIIDGDHYHRSIRSICNF